jgi:membrane-bound lytic murein transglycosylase F
LSFVKVSTSLLPARALSTRAWWVSLLILVSATLISSYLFQARSVATNTASQALTQLEQIQVRGYLNVITRNSPTTYFEDRDVPAGFEYEMAKRFADALGVDLRITVAPTMEDIMALVEMGEVDLAAAGLTVTSDRKQRVRFSSAYLQVQQKLIYNKNGAKPTSLKNLTEGKLVVVAGSSHAEYLRRVQSTLLPSLTWIEASDLEAIDLLHMVASGEIDFTIVDSHEYDIVRGFLTNLADAFEISSQQSLAWATPKNITDRSLQYAIESFFVDLRSEGTLLQLQDRYFGHLENFDRNSAVAFSRLKAKRLNRYQTTFKKAANKYQLEWELLAAIGYQESHWNPNARSRTGVRGLMMLTRPTAKLMGVTNRVDATQSIEGGAKYFAHLLTKFEHIPEPERTWFALASYNVGYGHLLDAQMLTRNQGGDPEKWLDVKKRLPLLSQKQWYSKTKYGYARGYEPVRYVENIRRYYDMLIWHTNPHQPAIEPENGSLLAASSIITVPPLL